MATKPDELFNKDNAPSYDERFLPLRPFMSAIHLCARLLLSRLPVSPRILSVGAGSGEEVLALAGVLPDAEFILVEPSAAMMSVAVEKLTRAGLAHRCQFHSGYLDTLPQGEPCHAALALFVSHFILQPDQRTEFFSGIHQRLHPGGQLIHSDLSFSESPGEDATLLHFHREALQLCGIEPQAMTAIAQHVSILRPAETASMLTSAGFLDVQQIVQTGLMRSWLSSKA